MATQLQTENKIPIRKAFTPVSTGLLQRKCACGNLTMAGGECKECTKNRNPLKRKLTIGATNDPLEQEADRVADQVLSMPLNAKVNASPPRIQRFSGQFSNKSLENSPPSVDHVLTGSGKPLEPELKLDMETRFGQDFSQVRVHTDSASERSARDVNAHAYTVGHDIVFGSGQYAPESQTGKRLLAHELTHVIQQSATGTGIIKQVSANIGKSLFPGRGGSVFQPINQSVRKLSRQAAPAAGRPCSGGAADPCQLAFCSPTQQGTGLADIGRGLSYVNASFAALTVNPITAFTQRAMDWYFGGHDASTVATVNARLSCIAASLSAAPSRYGCDPNYDALAYTCASGAAICGNLAKDICFTNSHFDQNPRERAITAIHEAAHLQGMSTGSPNTNPDIYEHQMRFLDMAPSQAVQNSDSYALFAAAIGTDSIPSTILANISAGGGFAFTPQADRTWYFQGTLGAEYQHPRLRVFNPTLGLGLTLIGEAENRETGARASTSVLTSLLFGLRLGLARRPGAGGALELSLFGGPALSLRTGSGPQVGAVAGVAVGYRWRFMDVSLGAGYAYDPRRSEAGVEHTATVGGTFTINLK